MLKLFYYILGSNSPISSVKIEAFESVSDLKKAILKDSPNDLARIDARLLTLYKVDIPAKGEHEGLAQEAINEDNLMDPPCELSEYFEGPVPRKKINIVVKLPGKHINATSPTSI